MDKRRLHHLWTKLRVIKPWYFFSLALILGVICVFALRSNYQHMSHLRDAVYQADKDNGDTRAAIQNLRDYVYAHMNTNLSAGNTSIYPPIQLKYTYDRLSQAAAQSAAGSNQQLYTEAQAYCQKLNSTDFSGHNRVPCIIQYVTTHGVKVQPVPDSLYKFDFISPRWSPDLAGWSMLGAVFFLLLAITFWLLEHFIRRRIE